MLYPRFLLDQKFVSLLDRARNPLACRVDALADCGQSEFLHQTPIGYRPYSRAADSIARKFPVGTPL